MCYSRGLAFCLILVLFRCDLRAQESGEDRNLELCMDKVIRASVEKRALWRSAAGRDGIGQGIRARSQAWKVRDAKLILENPVLAGLRGGLSQLVLTWLANSEPS